MSDELERLRADLEVLKHYESKCYSLAAAVGSVEEQIARLEAEADPWRKAKDIINRLRENRLTLNTDVPKIICGFFDHLTAERDRLAARVAELEAALEPPFGPSESEIRAIKPQDEKAIMDAAVELMEGLGGKIDPDDFGDTNPPKFEIAANRTVKYTEVGPLKPRDVSSELDDVDDDPILDPARVLATACELLHQLGGHWQAADARSAWKYSDLSFSAKPYRLKGGGE